MSEWASDKILNSWFITHETPNGYEIHFATPDMEKYLAVQEECRRQIRHAKPMTNADKIRQMSDEELEAFLISETDSYLNSRGDYWFEWLKQEVDK